QRPIFFAAALPVQSLLRQLQLERARQRLRAVLFLGHGAKITILFPKTKCNLIAGSSWPTSCQWFCSWLYSRFANSSRPAVKHFPFVMPSSRFIRRRLSCAARSCFGFATATNFID